MARTAITVQTPTIAGATPTYGSVDQANGNSFVHPGGTILIHVKNTNGSTRTLTIGAPTKHAGLSLTAPTVTIPATTGDKMICGLDYTELVQSDGSVYLDWDASSGVTIAIVKVT